MTRLLLVKLLRDLRSTRARILIMIVAIGISLTAFSAILYTRTIVDREITRSYLATNPASATIRLDGTLDPARLADVRTRPGVTGAALRTQFDARFRTGDSWSEYPLQTFGYAPDDPLRVATFAVERGAWPPPADGILLERLALDVLGVKVGDTITVQPRGGRPATLRITGVVHDPGLAPASNEAKGYGYVSTNALARLGLRPDLNELKITVASLDRATVESVARDVAASLPVRVEQIQVPPPGEHPHQGQMNAILSMVLMFGALSLLLSALLVATMLNSLLSRQIPQIGILKAVGARSGRVVQLYLIMVLLVATAATAVGFPLGILLGRPYSRLLADRMLNMDVASTSVPPGQYALVLATGLLLPVIMALVPLVRAGRVTVRQAIDHDGTPRGKPAQRWLGRLRGLDRGLLLALRNMFRRRGRLILAIGLLAGAGTLFTGALNTLEGIRGLVDNATAEHRVNAQLSLGAPAPAGDLTRALAGLPGATRVEAWRAMPVTGHRDGQVDLARTYPDQGHGSFRLAAVPPDTTMLNLPLVDGRWLRPDDVDAIVLNQSQQVNGVKPKVGDTVELSLSGRPVRWRVVGIEREVFALATAYVSPAGLARATGDDRANQVQVRGDRPGIAADAERALVAAGFRVDSAQPSTRYAAVVDGHVYAMIGVVTAIAVVLGLVGFIGLGSTMSTSVLERTREFGVLHAIGVRPRAVRRIVVLEGLFVALASLVVTALPAAVLTAVLRSRLSERFLPLPLRVSWLAIVIWAGAVLLGATLATLAPAYRASRLTVREALAYA